MALIRQKTIEKSMKAYRKNIKTDLCEEKILETINKSKEIFYATEQERVSGYWEFLLNQAGFIRKRWWFLQILVLSATGFLMQSLKEDFYIQRSMGIAGVLFIIMVIPELWKNQSYGCTEIEASSYYSLRQIYSARILLFGIVDILLLTVFCLLLHGRYYFTLACIISQFIFPMAVTACICYGLLCNKYFTNETVPVLSCFVWSAAWWLITVNGKIYTAITLPVWAALTGAAFLFLVFAIYKIINGCDKRWEENLKWN